MSFASIAYPEDKAGRYDLLLAQLRAHYADAADVLLIECERPKAAPDETLARERIRFYTQAGAQLTSVRIWLFDVEYSILVLPCGERIPACDWAEQMLSLLSARETQHKVITLPATLKFGETIAPPTHNPAR